jgi:DNA-binding response OmpR family regulator
LEVINLLLVEDSSAMKTFIRTVLESNFNNIQIEMVNDGIKAMKEVQRKAYDIVLCDWNLPLLSGDKFLQWVRETPALETIPFIMITGRTSEKDILRAKELGVNDYIVKPVREDVLINKLSTTIDTLSRT